MTAQLEENPTSMKAMVLEGPGAPLRLKEMPVPVPQQDQVLLKVLACGICRTDLHIVDHELPSPKLPLIPGHEIVAMVVGLGADAKVLKKGDLVGVPWLGYTCGKCKYCLRNQENLCENALFTGYTLDGGYAEYTVAFEKYCFPIAPEYANASGAPLLCAGLIGFRSYSMIPATAEHIGLYGFGAAAHILVQIAKYQHKKIYAFTREGDKTAQAFALNMGAVWAGSSADQAPVKLDAAILFAPAGALVPKALQDIDKGGAVICGGIHMSAIPSFPYALLWEERSLQSVANLTRQDGADFFAIAAQVHLHTQTETYALEEANEALAALRTGKFNGAAVLVIA